MENSLKVIVAKLEELFQIFNNRFYEGKLEQPVITVSPDTAGGSYGWFTVGKVWINSKTETGHHEINICAETLARPFHEVCETLLHEMVHLYCSQNEIKDTSRGGRYHNKKYKEEAERHGLTAEQSGTHGYTRTSLAYNTLVFVNTLNSDTFTLYRMSPKSLSTAKTAKSSSRKYVCPVCNASVRATREVHIMCADCNELMECEE